MREPERYAVYGLDEQGIWLEVYSSPDRADAEGFFRRLKSVKPGRRIKLVEQQVVRSG